jgi:hypothetical protein
MKDLMTSVRACQNKDCLNDKCPGSDDEKHHCDECLELEDVEDGKFCAMCNNYYCFTHWDGVFITHFARV